MSNPEEASPARETAHSAARCRHFGLCGGCATQDIPYEDQLKAKQEGLLPLLGPHTSRLRQIVASPSPWFYRNKMEFAFGFYQDAIALGLRRRGRFYGVVNLEECLLMSEKAGGILDAARGWASRHGLAPYHLRKHQGFLRYVVLREGKRTGDMLAVLVTAPVEGNAPFDEPLRELGEELGKAGVSSLLWAVTDRKADLAVGEIRAVVTGRPSWKERLGGVDFALSPYSFFQPNVELSEMLIEKARCWLGEGWPVLLDLYSGVGGLSLTLAGCARRTIGVELDQQAVRDAEANAAANAIGTASFVAEDAPAFIRRFSNFSFLADKWAVMIDPPRAGMHPRMPSQILRVAPPVLLYVSCNPKKLAEDLGEFTRYYRLEEAVPYDFFPHTPHVEILAKLVRK